MTGRWNRTWPVIALVALWLGLAEGLQALTTRVLDWFYMTDELLYERLAASVARSGSPLPRLHGQLVPVVDQLYPLLIAPAYRHGLVPGDLHQAHALNAWIMSSAAIPAFVLARRVTRSLWASYAVAVLTVCVPWIVYASFLLTEVAAYPAFLWAALAIHGATSTPSRRNDVLALLGIVLAVFARTQFVVLFAVLPLALMLHEGRLVLRLHRLLAWAYAAIAAGILALIAIGRFTSTLGIYGATVQGRLLPSGIPRAFLDHVAVLALGIAVLPFLVGTAWLLSSIVRPDGRRELHAFASLALVALAVLAVEATLFDLRFGDGRVRDRYLFYVAPLILCAFFAALCEDRKLRWSLLPPTLVVAAGFAIGRIPDYGRLNVDSPVAVIRVYMRQSMHSATTAGLILAALTVLLALLYLQRLWLPRRTGLTALFAGLTLVAVPAESAYAFQQLFHVNGTAGRPLTVQQGGVFDWVDHTIGTRAHVTMVPYPHLPGDYFASIAFSWDLEFWNLSVDRTAFYPGEFEDTPSTFPKLYLHFDERTGRANMSATRYVAQSDTETRFRISGNPVSHTRDTLLIDTEHPWRTDWLTFRLYDDGWTKPGAPATIRVFATPGQKRSLTRYLSIGIRAPFLPAIVPHRAFEVVSNIDDWRDDATGGDRVQRTVAVCVPANGFADVSISTPDVSLIYGDLRDENQSGLERSAGVLVNSIALADEIGPAC